MGRLPGQNATKKGKDGYLSVGEEEMLIALESTLKAVEDGNIFTTEYSFKFTTAKVNKQAGSLKRTSGKRHSSWSYKMQLSFEMFIEVKTAFEAVENGSLNERDYYFELTTPYFHFASGDYPLRDKDGSTRSNGHDDGKGPVPCILGDYFPVLNSIWETPLSLIKKIIEVGSVLPSGSKKKINGHGSSTVRFILVASVLIMHAEALPIAKEEQLVTLTAGTNGIVPFECRNEHQSASKYTTVTFEGKDRPFYIDGNLDPEGLMSPHQAERFRVEYYEEGSAMSIEISIASVSVEDQGTYVVMVIVQLGEAHEYHLMKKVVIIIIPPGPADCFLIKSEIIKEFYEVHCDSKPGNGNSTLTCFQNNDKLRYLQNTLDTNQVVHRRVFWLMNLDIPFSCCAHDVKEIHSITQESCSQYRFPRIEPVTRPLPPGNKAPTEIARTTKPLPIEEKNQQPTTKNTSNSGCTQNFAWPMLLLPVMTVMTYSVCISVP